MKNKANIIWGAILIILGVIFGLNALNITRINIFFKGWWTAFIILPCFVGLFKDKNKVGNTIGLIIGVMLLLASQGFINFDIVLKLLIPFILVILGLSVIFKDKLSSSVKKEIKKLNRNNLKNYCATFGSQDINFSKEKFEGCSLDAIFGGIKCDLRNSIIKKDTILEANSIFGGITIFVPDDVRVKVSSTPIFGGVSDERKTKNDDAKVTLYINSFCMFGGVDIK